MKVLGIYTDWTEKNEPKGCGFYRIVQPLESLKKKGHKVDIAGRVVRVRLSLKGLRKESAIELWTRLFTNYDLIYAQHVDDPVAITQMYGARDYFKKKVIVDIDDDVYNLDPYNPHFREFKMNGDKLAFTENSLKWADAITVTNENLARIYGKLNPNVHILENRISSDWFKYSRKAYDDDLVRIGYCGSTYHISDLELIYQAVLTICKRFPKVKFCVYGIWSPLLKQFPYAQLEYYPMTEGFKKWPKRLAKSGIDIGLCPLTNNIFNKGKSPIKFFEYSMNDIATIASEDPTLPYSKVIRHNETGLLAGFHKDWVRHLERLVLDEVFRKRIAQNAKDEVSVKYDMDNYSDQYMEVFKNTCQACKN